MEDSRVRGATAGEACGSSGTYRLSCLGWHKFGKGLWILFNGEAAQRS
jgi:hypothetical protein